MDNIPDQIYFKNADSRFTMISNSLSKMFNLSSPEQAVGKTDFDFFTEEYARSAFDGEQMIIRTGQSIVGIEEKETWSDGPDSWVSTTKLPLCDENGNIVGTFGISRNITERKQAEEALKESEAKYRLMVESSRDAIVISQNDIFIFFNEAFAKMLGYDMRELEALNYKDIYTEKAVEYLKEHTRQRTNGEDVPDRYETLFKRKDGSEIDVEANITIIDYKGQKATFAVIRDITKQKEIFKTLQKSARQTKGLKDFISICAGCNKIRDDEQENRPWVSPAVYIVDRLPDINFSHGMCPDCMKKWYPDFADKVK